MSIGVIEFHTVLKWKYLLKNLMKNLCIKKWKKPKEKLKKLKIKRVTAKSTEANAGSRVSVSHRRSRTFSPHFFFNMAFAYEPTVLLLSIFLTLLPFLASFLPLSRVPRHSPRDHSHFTIYNINITHINIIKYIFNT